jgi:hypothetical protein
MNDDAQAQPQAPPDPMHEFQASIERLTKDMRNAAITLSTQEARFLVNAYYAMQRDRIRADHQSHKLGEAEKPHTVIDWLGDQRGTLEKQVARALDAYSGSKPLGQWARSITGIGPIIAAGLLAHIDITKAPTAGHIWRYAGLDPTTKKAAGTKLPWNADLKRLQYLIGESFVKVSGNASDVYGQVYKARKEYETARNEAGAYADQAATALAEKKWDRTTDAYKAYITGKLPLARVHMRAKRYAVKLFLSHYHHVAYQLHHGTAPPKPYILDQPGHAHYIGPPNWP